jgi:hypothetical protein
MPQERGMTVWRYDPDSRTVFDAATGDAVCIVSDLSVADETHRIGRRIAHFSHVLNADGRFFFEREMP